MPIQTLDPIVQRLEEIRQREGMTQNAMARRLGVDRGLWSRIRRGKISPGRSSLERAFRAYPELHFLYAVTLQESSRSAAS